MRKLSNIIGVDDGPFTRGSKEPVLVVAPVFAANRLDGLLTSHITQDGGDATVKLARLINTSHFAGHAQLIMLGGITLGGFNVVDIRRLHQETSKPILVVARRAPNFDAIRRALSHLSDGNEKWALIDQAGPPEPQGEVWIQRSGLSREEAHQALRFSTSHGNYPEPLRIAHILAGGFVTGHSHGGA